MSESNPLKLAYDMKRFRLAVRKMWQDMQAFYRINGTFLFRLHGGRLYFQKVPFPELADFEIKAARRKEDRL